MSCTQEGGVSCPDLQVVESSEQEICAHTSELRTHTARGELCEIESTTERNSQAASVLRDVLCPPFALLANLLVNKLVNKLVMCQCTPRGTVTTG